MRPWPARSIVRVLATLLVALGPSVAWAGPPVLPPTGQEAAVPASAKETPFASTPVQRPTGMPETRFVPVQPAKPVPAPVTPGTSSVWPATPAPAGSVAPVAPTAVRPTSAVPATPASARPPAIVTVAPVGPTPAPVPKAKPTPPSPAAISPDALEPAPGSPDAALVATAEPPRKTFQHRGLVADFRIGTLGCIGALCRGGHDVSPGVRLGGFLGGNIRGWVEIGVGGGWGTLGSKVTPGTNAMALYGLDPNVLQLAFLAQLIDVDLAGLAVQDDKLRAAQFGPSLRVHLLPRGRIGAFVGSGVGYNVLRARYQTAMGDVGMAFHGIDVPVEANLSVYVLEHLAVGVQFDYMWTWYGLAVLDHPQQRIPIPMRLLEASAATQGVDVREQLPQFWTLGLAIRGRL